MAYELYFRGTSGPLGGSEFARHFKGREEYSIEKGSRGRAANYDSELTEVHFGFGWTPEACDLRVNYLRLTFFAVEAAIEAREFAETLDLLVAAGPEADRWEPFDAAAFVADWVAYNDAAIDMCRRDHPEAWEELLPLPADHLRAIWEWNYYRGDAGELFVEDFDDAILSPVSVFEIDGRPEYVTTWPRDCAIAVPDVATVVALAEDAEGEDASIRLAAGKDVRDAIGGQGRRLEDFAATVSAAPVADEAPAALRRLFDDAPPMEGFDVVSVPFHMSLDAD